MKKQTNELAVAEPSVAQMLSGMVTAMQKGEFTSESVKVLESMVGLYERMEAKKAEKEFAAAFHQLMAEIPKISAIKPVPAKDGTIKYYTAPLDEIDGKLRPMASKFGFTYRWAEVDSGSPDKVTETCIVQHVGGHKEISPYTVRRSAPHGANDSQADVSTHSYARRGSLCDAFGIIVDHSDDARMEGGKPICKAEAEELEAGVKRLGINESTFLKYAGAANFESISEDRYDSLLRLLERKEQEAQAITGGGVKQVVAEAVERGKIPEPKNEQGEYIL